MQYRSTIRTAVSQSWLLALGLMALLLAGCEDEPGDIEGRSEAQLSNKAFVIAEGPQALTLGEDRNVTFTPKIIDSVGRTSIPETVLWSSSDPDVVTLTDGGTMEVQGGGVAFVRAQTNIDSFRTTTEIPIRVDLPSPLRVTPWAAVLADSQSTQLTPHYDNTEAEPAFSYSVADPEIASVNNTGRVTAQQPGRTIVTVRAEVEGNSASFRVPVLVKAPLNVTVPANQVRLTPQGGQLFRGQTMELDATVIAANGLQRNDIDVAWRSSNETIAEVDQTGRISAQNPGRVTILAEAEGMIGSATLEVLPDTSIVVRPAETTVPAGGNRSFTASVYNLRNGSLIQDHAPIDWRVPAYPPALSRFAIGSVSADSLGDNATLAVANDAASGVTAPLRAQIGDGPFQQGGARVTIGTDTTSNDPTPSPQGCGPGNPAVATIQIQNGTDITIDRFGGMHQIEAVARNGSGNVVSTPELRYTTADENVALVDQNGQITATGTAGTTTITVCSGDFAAAAITVRVQ